MGKENIYSETFRIGDCVIGGVINVNLLSDTLTIKFLDFYNNDLILVNEVNVRDQDSYEQTNQFLKENLTPYYSSKIMNNILNSVNLL